MTFSGPSPEFFGAQQVIGSPFVPDSYNGSGAIPLNTVLLTLDCLQHPAVSIQCIALGTNGVVTPEWSNNNVDWVAATIVSAAGVPANTITASGMWIVPVIGRFLRLRLSTATTAGATTFGVGRLSMPRDAWAITPTLAAGANLVGDIGVQYRPSSTGAANVVVVMSPATPAAATIKATGGRIIGFFLQNSAAALRSVKIFGTTTPTLGTTAAFIEIDIPAGWASYFDCAGGFQVNLPTSYTVTSAKGLSDNTATGLAANDVTGFILFA